MARHGGAILIALALVLGACSPPVAEPTATASAPAASSVAATAAPSAAPASGVAATAGTPPETDLERLVAYIARAHPDPWFAIDQAEFEEASHELGARIETLRPEEQLVEVMRLMARIGAEGRNGHMLTLPADRPLADRLPVTFHLFEDGVFVVAATPAHEELVGRQVVEIGSQPVEAALDVLRPLVNRDNEHTDEWLLPLFLSHPAILAATGLSDDPTAAELVVRGPDDAESVTLAAEPSEPLGSPLAAVRSIRLPAREDVLWLSNPDTEFWSTELPGSGAVYAQYNSVFRPSGAHVDALRSQVAASNPDRIVLDLRHNPGGEIPYYGPLLDALVELEAEGRVLVVLVGRATFSAGVAFAAELGMRTEARFVGEPTAGSPTTYAGAGAVPIADLDARIVVFVPDLLSSVGPPGLDAIEPDLVVRLDAAAFFADRDPVLEAALGPLP